MYTMCFLLEKTRLMLASVREAPRDKSKGKPLVNNKQHS